VISERHAPASTSSRHRRGIWKFPTGNDLVAYLEADGRGTWRNVVYEWTVFPQIDAVDARHFVVVALPEVERLAQEFLERRSALVLVG
jgi:hypothetical protein